MSLSYSDISNLLTEAKKKKPSTTGDFESPKVDDSSVKITEGSFTIGPGHKGAMKGSKIYNKGKSTTNPNERDAFLKKSGAQLPPLAQKKPSTQMAGYQPEGELIEETDMRFCPKCEKMEVKEECAYGPDYWDTFAIKNVSQKVEEGLVTTALAVGAGGYAAYKGLKHLKKKADSALDNARQNSQVGAGTRQRNIEKAAGVKPGTLDPNMQRLRNSYEPEGEMTEGFLDRVRSTVVKTGEKVGGRIGTEKAGPIGGMIGRNRGGKVAGKAFDQTTSGNVSGAINTVRDALKNSYESEGELVDEGKKDACYHKVKSRYSVWPSAYASGALVKCRKKGAANWGNKTKKESYEISNWRDDFHATEVESVDLISNEPLQPTQGLGSDMLDEAKSKQDKLKEISKQLVGASKMHAKQSKQVAKVADNLDEAKKCWKGYKKAGTQKLFGKTYNRCVKAHFSDWRSDMDLQEKKKKNCGCGKDPCKTYGKQEVKEDWQKSNRKDGVDGMSQKSVNAYKRANPGSKLKTAVTGKVKKGSKDSKRRKSFCARSKGQKDMHNIDCSKTPEKKICKARKRWRC